MGLGRYACAAVGGGVAVWGSNSDGQLGLGRLGNEASATRVPWLAYDGAEACDEEQVLSEVGLLPSNSQKLLSLNKEIKLRQVAEIAVGASHCVAVCAAPSSGYQEVISWGSNKHGEVGVGSEEESIREPVPVSFFTGIRVVAVSCGDAFTVAVCGDGGAHEVVGWGNNTCGQLGFGSSKDHAAVPTILSFFHGRRVENLCCGAAFTIAACCGAQLESEVVGWGSNQHGQLGLPCETTHLSAPQSIDALKGIQVRTLECGGSHTIAVCEAPVEGILAEADQLLHVEDEALRECTDDPHNGHIVIAWGANDEGQLGLGSCSESERIPAIIHFFDHEKVELLSCGALHNAAVCCDGDIHRVYTWGAGSLGQLGLGVAESKASPSRVAYFGDRHTLHSIFCGADFTIAVCRGPEADSTENLVVGWGCNAEGQLGLGHVSAHEAFPVRVGFNADVHSISPSTILASPPNADLAMLKGGAPMRTQRWSGVWKHPKPPTTIKPTEGHLSRRKPSKTHGSPRRGQTHLDRPFKRLDTSPVALTTHPTSSPTQKTKQRVLELTEQIKLAEQTNRELEDDNANYERDLQSACERCTTSEKQLGIALQQASTLRAKRAELQGSTTASAARDQGTTDIYPAPLYVVEMEELLKATYDLSPAAVVGQGSFGTVYRAFWRGTAAAIKVLDQQSDQGTREFLREIAILGTCQHPSIVPLLAVSVDDGNRVLVYKLMAGGSLEDRLYFRASGTPALSWQIRLNIVYDCMLGLEYLHSKKHLHRDIKAANVLLDSDNHAALGDVGLARDLHSDGSNEKSLHLVGTPGYLDPEFAVLMTYTPQSDLFGMGIIMLEVITRIPSIACGKTLLERLEAIKQEGQTVKERADPEAFWPTDVLDIFSQIAVACAHPHREARPSVKEVVENLEKLVART